MGRLNSASISGSRGAVEFLGDAFVFRWTVNEAGYEWRDGKDGKLRLFPLHAPGYGIRIYTPDRDLFRQFALVEPTRDGVQAFAEKYGDLVDRWDISRTPKSGGLIGGTSLDRWKAKIGDMRALVEIWDQIQAKQIDRLKKIIVRVNKEVCYVRHGSNITLAREGELCPFSPKDVLLPARYALQFELNKRLADAETPTLTVPRLTWTLDDHLTAPTRPQRIVLQPCNLLAAMWLQFAQATIGAFQLKQCVVCGEFFQVGPGARRSDTETCGARCRKRRSRNRL